MYAYSQHELIEPPVVMGEKLLPLCLGHIDVLCGLESPIYRSEAPSPPDLAKALFVCTRPPETARREIRTGQAKRPLRRLGKRFWRMKPELFSAVTDAFLGYVAIYSTAPPRWENPGEKTQERAPWHLCIFAALQKQTNHTPDECWNMPLPKALELFAALCANSGDTGLVTAQEMDVFDAMQSGEKDVGEKDEGGNLRPE